MNENRNKKCIIFAAGEFDPKSFSPCPGAYVIAADAGLEHARKLGITPALTVGDFDSEYGELINCGKIVRHPPEKDDTDTMLAVNEALAAGYSDITIYGALGGRLDHTLANLQTLGYIVTHAGKGELIGTDITVHAITNSELCFPAGKRGNISLFSLGDKCTGVTLTGLKYPLNNYTITNTFPIGISNEFTGEEAKITVADGILIIITNI